MIQPIADEKAGGAPHHAAIVELLRDGPPDEAAAREKLRGLIARLDPRTRRLLRTDPSLARALWLMDLARIRDRETRRTAARRRGKQCLVALALLAAFVAFLLTLILTLQAAHEARGSLEPLLGRPEIDAERIATPGGKLPPSGDVRHVHSGGGDRRHAHGSSQNVHRMRDGTGRAARQ